jgi:hypothetical protein
MRYIGTVNMKMGNTSYIGLRQGTIITAEKAGSVVEHHEKEQARGGQIIPLLSPPPPSTGPRVALLFVHGLGLEAVKAPLVRDLALWYCLR